MILCMSILKGEWSAFDDLLPIEQGVVILLHQLTHLMTSIKCTRQQQSHQIVIIVAGTESHIDEGLQVCKIERQFPSHGIALHFLGPSDCGFHERVQTVGVEFRIKFLQKMLHTSQIFRSRCDELWWVSDVTRQGGWSWVKGEVVKNAEINIVLSTGGIIFWCWLFKRIHL